MYIAAEDRYGKIPYRRCGRSGIKLPAISLGLWHNFGDITPFGVQKSILRTAFDNGITHFDLANNYGPPYFGIVYGISPFSLSQDIHVTVAEAKEYMEKYFAHYAGVRAYMDAVVEQAKADGYVSTLFGRRRWVPELKSSNFNTRSFGERVALNAPIQGTAADIIKLAMIRVRDRLAAEGLEGRLVLQVHDELIVECPEAEAEQVCRLVKEEMEAVASLPVALLADTAAGKSWAAAH